VQPQSSSAAAVAAQPSSEAASGSSGPSPCDSASAPAAAAAAASPQRQPLVRVEDIGLDQPTAPSSMMQTAAALVALDWSPLQSAIEAAAAIYHCTSKRALIEFIRFLLIKCFTHDESAEKVSPTPLMDQLWHAAILDTRFYRRLQTAIGMQLDHSPSGASSDPVESRRREVRRKLMAANYQLLFGGEPLAESEPGLPAAPGGVAVVSSSASLSSAPVFPVPPAAAAQSHPLGVDVAAQAGHGSCGPRQYLGTVPPGMDPTRDSDQWVECRITRSRGGPPLSLLLGPGATLDWIKRVLQDKLGIPTAHQCLARSIAEQHSGCSPEEQEQGPYLKYTLHVLSSLSLPRSALDAGWPLPLTLLQLSGRMPITIKTLDFQTIDLLVDPETTVEELKQLLQNKEGTPADIQRLIFAGKQVRTTAHRLSRTQRFIQLLFACSHHVIPLIALLVSCAAGGRPLAG